MHQIIRTRQADVDLLNIWLFFAEEDMDRADEILDSIEARYQILADYPMSGKRREELGIGIRGLVIGSYLVFYRVMNKQVEILRVLHRSRDLDSIFNGNER